MDRRIASLALARFRVGGFVGTSIADLAGALGVSKAAIYHHYREVVPLITTDVAILNHPSIGPRLHAQNLQLQSLLATPRPRSLGQVASRGGPRGDLASPDRRATGRPHRPCHQHTLIDAAVATLQPNQPSPDGKPVPAPEIRPHAEHGGSTGR